MNNELYLNDGIVGEFGGNIVTEMLLQDNTAIEGVLVSISMQTVNDTDTSSMMYLTEDMVRQTIKYLEKVLLEDNDKKQK